MQSWPSAVRMWKEDEGLNGICQRHDFIIKKANGCGSGSAGKSGRPNFESTSWLLKQHSAPLIFLSVSVVYWSNKCCRKKYNIRLQAGKKSSKSIHETSFSTASYSVHSAVSVCHVTSGFCFSVCFVITHQKSGFSQLHRDGIRTKCGSCGSGLVWVSAQTFAFFKVCLVGVLKHLQLGCIKIGPVPCKVKRIKCPLCLSKCSQVKLLNFMFLVMS